MSFSLLAGCSGGSSAADSSGDKQLFDDMAAANKAGKGKTHPGSMAKIPVVPPKGGSAAGTPIPPASSTGN